MQLIFVCQLWICYFAEFIDCFNNFFKEFSTYKIIPPADRNNFTSSFAIWMHFISYSCLIILARTSSTMLKRNGKNGHPRLVPNLRRKPFSLSPLSMIFTVGFSCMAFIMLR